MMTSITQIGKTNIGKALILIWALMLLILIVLPLLGFLQHEFLGNLAFGFLLSSFLLNLSIIISYKVENGSIQIVKAGWAGLGVVILGFALYLFDGKPNSDIAVFLGWAMLVHAFPGSLIVNLLFAEISLVLYNSFSVEVKVGYIYLLVVWLVFFVIGYLQWFKLLPILLAKFWKRAEG